MNYRIDYTDSQRIVTYDCRDLAHARADARKLSKRYELCYVIARDGNEDVGQIVYYNGRTDHIDDRIK